MPRCRANPLPQLAANRIEPRLDRKALCRTAKQLPMIVDFFNPIEPSAIAALHRFPHSSDVDLYAEQSRRFNFRRPVQAGAVLWVSNIAAFCSKREGAPYAITRMFEGQIGYIQ